MLEEVRRKDWKESFAHHVVTLGLMYYRWAGRPCWFLLSETCVHGMFCVCMLCAPLMDRTSTQCLPHPDLCTCVRAVWACCCACCCSWYANFTRPGVLVMLIHDISDIFLESAKLANYAEQESLSLNLFIAFALSWVVLRCVIYPYMIVARVLIDPVNYIALPFNINPQPHYSAFGTMFLVLFFLHLYWTYLIFKVIEKQLRTGKADDVREDDD